MELYLERGYEQTTVADIAERAGLTARTFFRHFADKREVLFAGSARAAGASSSTALEAAPADAPPDARPSRPRCDAAADAARQRPRATRAARQAVIDANAELRERELIKLASLAAALADGPAARAACRTRRPGLAAETGIAVLRVAFAELARRSGRAPAGRGDARVVSRTSPR